MLVEILVTTCKGEYYDVKRVGEVLTVLDVCIVGLVESLTKTPYSQQTQGKIFFRHHHADDEDAEDCWKA